MELPPNYKSPSLGALTDRYSKKIARARVNARMARGVSQNESYFLAKEIYETWKQYDKLGAKQCMILIQKRIEQNGVRCARECFSEIQKDGWAKNPLSAWLWKMRTNLTPLKEVE